MKKVERTRDICSLETPKGTHNAVFKGRGAVTDKMDSRYSLWFRRTGAGLIYIQRESFKLNRQDFLTIYLYHSEMAGRSPCQMVSSPALKVFKLRMELREGLQG